MAIVSQFRQKLETDYIASDGWPWQSQLSAIGDPDCSASSAADSGGCWSIISSYVQQGTKASSWASVSVGANKTANGTHGAYSWAVGFKMYQSNNFYCVTSEDSHVHKKLTTRQLLLMEWGCIPVIK